ncbi:MAG TPA: hypothetical protein VHV83_16655 [Armatimonadota bacterium]|nr:hypothetical protein [Armatimonadota bacterium]
MKAILGTIDDITVLHAENGHQRLLVSCSPACVVPDYTPPPAWLHDARISVERDVDDPREVGEPGDNILLTPDESQPWLCPLRVTPAVVYGHCPDTILVTMHWWETNNTPPPVTVQANGRSISSAFTRHDDSFQAEIRLADFFPHEPTLPVHLRATCHGITAVCHILPADHAFTDTVVLPDGEMCHLENSWYRVDITPNTGGGAIYTWQEKGRDVDHFARQDNRIANPLEVAGHLDGYQIHMKPASHLKKVTVANRGAWREDRSSHLRIDGSIREAVDLTTSVDYTLFDAVPLLCWQRTFSLHSQTPPVAADTLQVPIEQAWPFGTNFRTSWLVDRSETSGSRIITAYRGHLITIRHTQTYRTVHGMEWRANAGWFLIEHPLRREWMLYCYDRSRPPHLHCWLEPNVFVLAPAWPMRTLCAGTSIGITLAASVGECAGADIHGAWIGCRTIRRAGGLHCAVIARFTGQWQHGTAVITVGSSQQTCPLQRFHVRGVGDIAYGLADFPYGRMDEPFHITVPNIPQRGEG